MAGCQIGQGLRRLAGLLPAMAGDRRGGTALLVAFSAPALVGGMVLSIDVGIWYLEKRRLQQISDTASLGAVTVLRSGGSADEAKAAARRDAIRNGFNTDGNSTLVVNLPPAQGPYAGDPNAVEVVATRKLPLLFSKFFLTDGLTVQARSVAIHSDSSGSQPRRNLEVTLILDVSTSMAGNSEIPGMTRLQAMQQAARKVVDVIIQSDQEPNSTRVAIVPYGSAVNVGSNYYKHVTNTNLLAMSTGVVERTGASAYTDDAPGPGRYFPSYTLLNQTTGMLGQGKERQSTTQTTVQPLSANKDQLKASIDAFTADGTTAGHIGLAWAWNTLSPKWSHVWSGDGAPTDYDGEKTQKIAVLMSDFDLTVQYTLLNGTASDQAMTLCAKMKAAGITIYTLGYRVPTGNAKAKKLRDRCASDPDKVYNAQTAEQLIAAFAAIAQSAAGHVMTKGPRLVE